MRSDKADINKFRCIFYNNHQSVIVAFNIEHIPLISHIINGIIRCLDISEAIPVSFAYFLLCIYLGSSRSGFFNEPFLEAACLCAECSADEDHLAGV